MSEEEKTKPEEGDNANATARTNENGNGNENVNGSASVSAVEAEPDGVAVELLTPPDPGSADSASPRLQSIVESILFAADKPLSLKAIAELLGETEMARVRGAVAAVEESYASRGFQLHQVAGGYQFRTNPENAPWVQKLLAQKPVKLSRAQLETLAIVAYRQPVTRPEVDEIRGVDTGGTLKMLLDRSLVRIVGKKEEPGRPLLYGTTREFLEFFNLGDLKDLPTLREFHELSAEHEAQVAALEGVAPEGSIEKRPEELTPVPPLSRLELVTPPEDERELAEIDDLIRTAGVVTDSDQPQVSTDEFEALPTQRFDPLGEGDDGAHTRLHTRTIVAPDVVVDEEFDHSETTNVKNLDPFGEASGEVPVPTKVDEDESKS
jgi:segregation and condensation protein B